MQRFTVTLVIEIEFVDGEKISDEALQDYKNHLAETVQDAAQNLSLRTVKDAHVESISITEI